MIDTVRKALQESARIKEAMAKDLAEPIARLLQEVLNVLKAGGKLLIMGNGGSASDAQHIAAELVGRCLKDRKGLPAIALTTDTSILTAVGNDYGYDEVFRRQVEALGVPGDLVWGISTSGNSENVYRALKFARSGKIRTIALLGRDGGKIRDVADFCVIVPSNDTPRIQEAHITIGHIICEEAERVLFQSG
jgi:D-sedoheptulose 7-phosphate isomerase